MELKLIKDNVKYFEPVFAGISEAEAQDEKIVPDLLRDATEVIYSGAVMLLRSKEASDGRVTVTAYADISVICRLENRDYAPLSLGTELVFTADAPDVTQETKVIASVCVQSVTARLINPRKISVTVKASASLRCYSPASFEYTKGAGEGLEEKTETVSVILPYGVSEKTFRTYAGGLRHGAGGELAALCPRIIKEEQKAVGSKLVVRGTLTASGVYRSDGEWRSLEISAPFSEVVDVGGAVQGCDFEVVPQITGTGIIRREGSEEAELEISAVLQCVQYRREELSVVRDAYSTVCPVTAEYGSISISEPTVPHDVPASLRGTLPADGAEKILSTCLCASPFALIADGSLRGSVRVKALYIGNGELKSAEGTLTAEAPCDLGDCAVNASVVLPREIYTMPSPQGIDVRGQGAFSVITERQRDIGFVSDVSCAENEESEKRPSVILHRVCAGETLWDVGRRTRASCKLIAEANGITDGALPPAGEMLLVPVK